MGEGWEILLSGVRSREKPTFRKQEPPVDMNTGPNVGDLSYSALLSLACGQTYRATLFLLSDCLGVGLRLTTRQESVSSLHTKDEECF